MPNITFRPRDDSVNKRLAALASSNGRPIAVEMRAAIDVYLDLNDLVRLRQTAASRCLPAAQRSDFERRIKDSIGRVLLAAISREAQSLFEDSAGVEDPARFGHIPTPFEKVIDWVVTGNAQA